MLNSESVPHGDTKDRDEIKREGGGRHGGKKVRGWERWRRASDSSAGTNAGTFAKTLTELVLMSNLNKAEELLSTQL